MPEFTPSKPARVPYVFPPPGTNQVADKIRERRRNGELIDLDAVLLNSEPVASGWNGLGEALRLNTTLAPQLVELLILRVSALNGSAYVWRQHEDIGRKVGLPASTIRVVRTEDAFAFASTGSVGTTIPPVYAAALDYADHMTRSILVPQPVFARFRGLLENDRQIVEATTVVGGYNLTTRVMRALDVAGMAEEEVPIPTAED